MENLKKNFEEPVVQIINMCFCENIATSGAIACPAGKKSYAGNQSCHRCKVIYYLEGTANLNSQTISNNDYIAGVKPGTSQTIKDQLNSKVGVMDTSDQITAFASLPENKCPAYPSEQ